MAGEQDIFVRLFEVIESRKGTAPGDSYVSSLMSKGVGKINSKIMEEAGEVCEAASESTDEHLVKEICDLLFHTFVLAGHKDISLADIKAELERRFGTSGHVEKASRGKE
jgi:phosphoribosyl-ATP pyrophosphohydrolase